MKKAIVILSFLLLVSVIANLSFWIRDGSPDVEERKETYIDTIPYRKPIPVDSVILRYVTERLPTKKESENGKLNITPSDSLALAVAEIVGDSVDVVLPITQKVYEDSTFRAYVSGYRPALDSIEIYRKSETIYIKSSTKPKRWSLGFQAGVGLTPQRVEPYIGIGISYNLICF